MTAALLEKFSVLHVSVSSPAAAAAVEIRCPTLQSHQTDYQAPAKDPLKSVVFDINPGNANEHNGSIVRG